MQLPHPRPVPAALAVLVRNEQVLLVRRANPPDAGKWGFPGGRLEWGETLAEATLRELAEETGIRATYDRVLTALDVLDGAPAALNFHYVLIASRCLWVSGDPIAADDALEARWFPMAVLADMADELSLDVPQLAGLAASG
jgi:8-oxo-dGTP diphosphatase